MALDKDLQKNLNADVVLTASNGKSLSVVLARGVDSQGNPLPKAWRMTEVPTPVNVRVAEQGASLVDLPPELEAVIYRDNHIGGIGERLTSNEGNRYYSGVAYTGVDGFVTLPPGADEITLPTSEGNVRVITEFDGAVFISDGRYLHRSTDGTTFTQVLDAGAGNVITNVTAFGAADGDTGIVVGIEDSNGASIRYQYSTDGTTFTNTTDDASRHFSYFFVYNDTLYGLDQPNTFRTTTDPFSATATWGSATEVGEELYRFQGGFIVSNLLVIFKTDRVYTVDSSGTVKILVAQFADTPDASNFEAFVAGHNSNIYFTVDEELWEYNPVGGGVRPLGIARLPDTIISTATSHLDAAAYDGVGVYALHHTIQPHESSGGTSIIRIVFDGEGTPTYERWLTTTASGYRPQGPFHVTRAFSSLNTGRGLYFNTTTAGKVGLLNLFRAPNPTEDTSSEYSTVDAHMYTGDITHNFPGQPKDYTELTLDVTGLSSTSTISAYYYLNGSSTRKTLIEDIDADGLYTLEFPEPTTARSIMLDFVRSTSSAADTPVIRSWALRAAVKFRLREVVTLAARVTDHVVGRNGYVSPHSAVDFRRILRELRETENLNIKYEDYKGYTFENVRVLPGFNEIDISDETKNRDETVLEFRVMKVSDD